MHSHTLKFWIGAGFCSSLKAGQAWLPSHSRYSRLAPQSVGLRPSPMSTGSHLLRAPAAAPAQVKGDRWA